MMSSLKWTCAAVRGPALRLPKRPFQAQHPPPQQAAARTTMRITGIRTFLMQAQFPPENAYATADKAGPQGRVSSQSGSRNWLFLKIDTDAGITGIGECSGWPRVVERAVQDLSSLLVG